MITIENQKFAELLQPYASPDCGHCWSYNVELTGKFQTNSQELYLGVKCNQCHQESFTGDGEFWLYYTLKNGEVERIE